ncbi:MAG: flagellar basal-body rod protein FlgB [Planctomycetes bacterium RBG_19FT_COMBO_48_8]|nr:MAG: flagellar basal-body rod protein FlgB [Planctomycetes bacterium RBG_19FT_COMBO_48_8]
MLKMIGKRDLARLLLFLLSRQGLCINIWELLMSKTENILDLIDAGIKAETLRQKAIANNVANLETPGYRRIDVKFEELLARCLRSSEEFDLSEIEAQIYRPKQTPVKSNGNDVNFEAEVGQMIKNTLRHKAYIRLLSKKYNQIELAIGTK